LTEKLGQREGEVGREIAVRRVARTFERDLDIGRAQS